MTGQIHTKTPDLPQRVNALSRRMRELAKLAAQVEEMADSVKQDLVDLRNAVMVPGELPPIRVSRRPKKDAETESLIAQVAAKGVTSVNIHPRGDGSADVQVDGGKSFHVAPQLAHLLSILCQGDTDSGDGFVGWKSTNEIATLLSKTRTDKKYSKHAVINLIYRLRKRLRDEKSLPQWIQSNRHGSYRFLLRRKPTAVIVCE